MQRVRRVSTDDGATAILIAVLTVVLFGVGALVVDGGMMLEQRRDAQRGADLAALAAGQDLPAAKSSTDDAVIRAAEYLTDNGFEVSASTLVNGDEADGEVYIRGNGTQLQVLAPTRRVSFALAGVFNTLPGVTVSDGVDVAADATVEIRSGLGILPFMVKIGTGNGSVCLKVGSDAQTPPGCPSSDTGNFGYADVSRSDGNNQLLEKNIALGLDHNPSKFLVSDLVAQGFQINDECRGNTPLGRIPDENGQPFNCLLTQTGNAASKLVDGLLPFSVTTVDCDGRVAVGPSGVAPDRVQGCEIAPDLWSTYQLPGGKISNEILDDPRFGFVPIVYANVFQGSSAYAIIDFKGVYLSEFWVADRGRLVECGQCRRQANLDTLKATMFSTDQLENDVQPNSGPTGTYLGTGPKRVVLID